MRRWVNKLIVCTGILALVSTESSFARAEGRHEVRRGESLGVIAQRYRTTAITLAAANRMTRAAKLRPGQFLRVPDEGEIFVGRGDTLAKLAREHGVDLAVLARLNRKTPTSPLQVGELLRLPGDFGQPQGASTWGRPKKPGIATFTVSTIRKPMRIRLVDNRGKANKAALSKLGQLMRPRGVKRGPTPPTRLLELLARVSDHFGGRKIHIVSGFRRAGGYTNESSRHTRGEAIDLHIDGVPNRVLRDYCRQLNRTGVGYYPNSRFVHLDVRDESAYWIDLSTTGQAPRYVSASSYRDGARDDENDMTRRDAQTPAQQEAEATQMADQEPPSPTPAAQPEAASAAASAAEPLAEPTREAAAPIPSRDPAPEAAAQRPTPDRAPETTAPSRQPDDSPTATP